MLAVGCQSASFLLTGQVKLRLMFLLGSSLSIFYFLIVLSEPVWEPAIEDIIMGLANIYGLSVLLIGRSTWLIPADQKLLFEKLGGIQPGEFRALMKHGTIRTLQRDEFLTYKDEVPDKLFYLMDGQVQVIRDGIIINLEECDFIGEISLILGTTASATTKALQETMLVEWDRKSLSASMKRNEELKVAIEALMAENMAHKVARTPNMVVLKKEEDVD